MTTDIRIENHGSIFLVRPLTTTAMSWLSETAPQDAQFFADALVVEHRYILDVIDAARASGLEVA